MDQIRPYAEIGFEIRSLLPSIENPTPSEVCGWPHVDVRPSPDVSGTYDLTPGSKVGTLVVEDLQVDIRPKITLDRVLFLVSYALDPDRSRDHLVAVDERSTVTEAMVPLWLAAAEVALRRGACRATDEETRHWPRSAVASALKQIACQLGPGTVE